MKTCKDCIGYDFCPSFYQYHEEEIKEYTDGDIRNLCECFKDKSKFIELPCLVGDTVYVISRSVDRDKCGECEHYLMGCFGDPPECMKTDDGYRAPECLEIEERDATFNMILHWMGFDLFGKTVFLTREEAEKKLEKLNDKV